MCVLCRSRDLIGNCIGAERGDYTWNGKRFCDLHIDSIRSLLVSLNAIKRTQLLTEHNSVYRISKKRDRSFEFSTILYTVDLSKHLIMVESFKNSYSLSIL